MEEVSIMLNKIVLKQDKKGAFSSTVYMLFLISVLIYIFETTTNYRYPCPENSLGGIRVLRPRVVLAAFCPSSLYH